MHLRANSTWECVQKPHLCARPPITNQLIPPPVPSQLKLSCLHAVWPSCGYVHLWVSVLQVCRDSLLSDSVCEPSSPPAAAEVHFVQNLPQAPESTASLVSRADRYRHLHQVRRAFLITCHLVPRELCTNRACEKAGSASISASEFSRSWSAVHAAAASPSVKSLTVTAGSSDRGAAS